MEITVTTNASEVGESMALRSTQLRGAMRDTMKTIENEALRSYRRTTDTWKHKPEFQALEDFGEDHFTVLVGTDDSIYRFVDTGTSEHIIQPKEVGGVLAFQWGGPGSYVAKTTPGVIGSQAGGPVGNMTFRHWVLHPGNAPRGFTKMIEETMRKFSLDLFTSKVLAILNRR